MKRKQVKPRKQPAKVVSTTADSDQIEVILQKAISLIDNKIEILHKNIDNTQLPPTQSFFDNIKSTNSQLESHLNQILDFCTDKTKSSPSKTKPPLQQIPQLGTNNFISNESSIISPLIDQKLNIQQNPVGQLPIRNVDGIPPNDLMNIENPYSNQRQYQQQNLPLPQQQNTLVYQQQQGPIYMDYQGNNQIIGHPDNYNPEPIYAEEDDQALYDEMEEFDDEEYYEDQQYIDGQPYSNYLNEQGQFNEYGQPQISNLRGNYQNNPSFPGNRQYIPYTGKTDQQWDQDFACNYQGQQQMSAGQANKLRLQQKKMFTPMRTTMEQDRRLQEYKQFEIQFKMEIPKFFKCAFYLQKTPRQRFFQYLRNQEFVAVAKIYECLKTQNKVAELLDTSVPNVKKILTYVQNRIQPLQMSNNNYKEKENILI